MSVTARTLRHPLLIIAQRVHIATPCYLRALYLPVVASPPSVSYPWVYFRWVLLNVLNVLRRWHTRTPRRLFSHWTTSHWTPYRMWALIARREQARLEPSHPEYH